MLKEDKTDDDEIKIDFSKIKNLFKRKKTAVVAETEQETVSESEKKNDSDFEFDFKNTARFMKKYSIIFLIMIPILLSIFFRAQPAILPAANDWAEDSVYNFYRGQISSSIEARYPNLPDQNKNVLIQTEFDKYYKENEKEVKQQIKDTATSFKSRLKDENGQTYLLAIDPYLFYRQTRYIIENGHPGDEIRDGVYYDSLKVAPRGTPVTVDLHTWFEVILVKIVRIFNHNADIMAIIFWVPLIIATLSTIPAFFIGRRVGGNVGGLFAATLVGIHSAFLGRTAAGFADTDAYNVFFPLLITWIFIESFESEKLKRGVLLAGINGLMMGLFAYAWAGWWYIFDFILGSIAVYFIYYTIMHRKDLRKGVKTFLKQKPIRNGLITAGAFIASSAIWVSFFELASNFFNNFKVSAFFTAFTNPFNVLGVLSKDVAVSDLWPRIHTTVAELNELSLASVISSMGGKLLFAIAILGVLLSIIKKDSHGRRDVKIASVLTIWLLGTVFASQQGVRFLILLVPAFSVAVGIAMGIIFEKSTKWLSKELNIQKVVSGTVIFILLCLLMITPMKQAWATAKSEVPSFNDAWYESLNKIKMESEPDAIINSWWDFGHWFITMGERGVTFDGSAQIGYLAHFIGRSLLTADETETVGLLRMIDCGQRNAITELEKFTNYTPDVIEILHEIIVEDEKEAEKILKKRGLSSEQIEAVLKNTHCDPPENYYITSEDMIGKGGVWGHFGSWDFTRAAMYQQVRNLEYDEGVTVLTTEFELSEDMADRFYNEIKSTPADNWIAPWPAYYSGVQTCTKQENNKFLCINNAGGQTVGFEVDMNTKDAKIRSSTGDLYPTTFVYAAPGDEEVVEKVYKKDIIPYSLVLIPLSNGGYQSLIADPMQANGIFTKLFFFEGHGLEHFKLFSFQRSFTGQNIYVWKVDWDGGEKNVLSALKPKENVGDGDTVFVNYLGWLDDGAIFDSSIIDWQTEGVTKDSSFEGKETNLFSFVVGSGQVIRGFDDTVRGMKPGETKTVELSPENAYGTDPAVHPLGNKTLNFKIQVVRIE